MTENHVALTVAIFSLLTLGACSSLPTQVSAVNTSTLAAASRPVTIHVHSGRPSLVYTLLSFDKACRPVALQITVDRQPTKGEVAFKPEAPGTVLSSPSGQCVGTRMAGTAVMYTARGRETGTDTFSITAVTGSGAIGTRAFTVEIVD